MISYFLMIVLVASADAGISACRERVSMVLNHAYQETVGRNYCHETNYKAVNLNILTS